MDKIDAIQRMRFVLDAAVHMHAASFACVALNRRLLIDDRELVAVCLDAQVVTRYHSNLRKKRSFGFPALGASADMIMRRLALYRYRDLLVAAMASKRSARKVCGRRLQPVIDAWMYFHVAHVSSSLVVRSDECASFATLLKKIRRSISPTRSTSHCRLFGLDASSFDYG